ncbi:MAG: hypothetical protein ACXV8O_13465 [Methylobacter sp.]
MKIKKVIHEISGVANMDQMNLSNIYFFKFFSLSIWLIIISIGLSFVAKSVQAGTEDLKLYYRYVPYEGPKSTTGTTGQAQPPKQSSGANETESKKADTGAQAPDTGSSANQAKENAGTLGEEAKKTNPNEPVKKTDESAVQSKEPPAAIESNGQAPTSGRQTGNTGQNAQPPIAKESKSEGSMIATEQKISPVKRPEKDTGEFPSGEFPSFSQVDVNGDHNVTKDELKNFPELLRVFDKVDAGKDGKLEQHEFQNLEMETTREGEVS